jgi:hypothetical protein
MAGEVQIPDEIGLSLYFIVMNLLGEIWNTVSKLFENVTSSNWSKYAIPLNDSVPATGLYSGNFPLGLPLGDYPVVPYEMATGTPAVGDFPLSGSSEVMHWDGTAEIPISSMSSPEAIIDALYDSYVVNTTTYRGVMTGWAAVNLGDLEEDEEHGSSTFKDVNDPGTTRVESINTSTSRSVTLYN